MLLAAPAALLFTHPVHAGAAAVDDAPGAASLEELVVTARRRAESLQTTPVAVTAMTAQTLQDKAVANILELSVATPSLTTTSVFSTTHVNFSMRGRAAENNQFGNSQVVEVYFSDVPQMAAPLAQFYDIGSVQILRGPQGTLFGRASNGGAILFAPQTPGHELEGFVQAKAGNLNNYELEAGVSIPIIQDKLAIRLSGNMIRRDGYTKVLNLDNLDLDDKHSNAYRIAISARPWEGVSNDFVYDHIDIDQNLGSTFMIAARPTSTASALMNPSFPGFVNFLAQNPDLAAIPGVAGGLQSYVGTLSALGARRLYLDQPADQLIFQNTVDVYSNTTTFDLGPVQVKNIIGYQRERRAQGYAADGVPLPVLGGYIALDLKPNGLALKRHMWTEELQVSGKLFDGRLDWLVGGFYQDLADEVPGNTLMGAAVTVTGTAASYVPNSFDRTAKALFTHNSFMVTDRLRVSAGFRRTWDKTVGVQSRIFVPLSLRGQQNGPSVCLGTNIPADFDRAECQGPPITLKSVGNNWTLGADYKVNDSIFTYVSASRGFRPGGLNTTATIPALLDFGTEKIQQYEAGLKLEHRFDEVATRLNVAVYQQDITDAQVGYIVFNPARRTTEGVNLNAPKTKVRGVEIEGEIVFNRYFRISAFADYIDAKYKEFGIPVFVVDPAEPGGVRIDSVTDVSSNPLPNVPEYHLGATVRIGLPIPEDLGEMGITATYFRQASIVFGSDYRNELEGRAGGYDLINAQFEWKNMFGRSIDGALFVKNLTDNTYIKGGVALQQQLGLTQAIFGEPRTYGVSLRYRFGAGN
ncbi:TonB-dependent receptor [Phenylobacterium sp.]|uniref:TonB-dependent receptor n=1 Tax=Phenylobacterium sp. TaxID=1871053 RepID=UPI00301D9744